MVGQHLLLASQRGFGTPDGGGCGILRLRHVFDGDAVFFRRPLCAPEGPFGSLHLFGQLGAGFRMCGPALSFARAACSSALALTNAPDFAETP